MTATLARSRYPWTAADERFLIAAKRERFAEKDIAHLLGRTPNAVGEKVKRLRESGVLLCHREEELDLLGRLMAEAKAGEKFRGERE